VWHYTLSVETETPAKIFRVQEQEVNPIARGQASREVNPDATGQASRANLGDRQ